VQIRLHRHLLGMCRDGAMGDADGSGLWQCRERRHEMCATAERGDGVTGDADGSGLWLRLQLGRRRLHNRLQELGIKALLLALPWVLGSCGWDDRGCR
jgi:hypothetical protein